MKYAYFVGYKRYFVGIANFNIQLMKHPVMVLNFEEMGYMFIFHIYQALVLLNQ